MTKSKGTARKAAAAGTRVSPLLAEPYVGYRKTSITFVTPRTKPLSEVTAADVPPGLDPEDVATDYAPPEERIKLAR